MEKEITVSMRIPINQHESIRKDCNNRDITLSKWLQNAADCYSSYIAGKGYSEKNGGQAAIDEAVKKRVAELKIEDMAKDELNKEKGKSIKEKVKGVAKVFKETAFNNPNSSKVDKEPETNPDEKKTGGFKLWWE